MFNQRLDQMSDEVKSTSTFINVQPVSKMLQWGKPLPPTTSKKGTFVVWKYNVHIKICFRAVWAFLVNHMHLTIDHQRVLLETCGLWDISIIWSEWWWDMTWPKKTKTKVMIIVTWQLLEWWQRTDFATFAMVFKKNGPRWRSMHRASAHPVDLQICRT